jgi:hypothetical protein
LALYPKFVVSNPVVKDEILRVIKTRGMTSFGGKVKLSAPCREILRHVKDHYKYDKVLG